MHTPPPYVPYKINTYISKYVLTRIYICIYTYVFYLYVYVYTYTYTYTCIYLYTLPANVPSQCIHTYIYTYTKIYMRAYTCTYIHIYTHIYVHMCIHMHLHIHVYICIIRWRRPIGCLKLRVIFRKRATNYRALLRKITYNDQASYGSLPPCNTYFKFRVKTLRSS